MSMIETILCLPSPGRFAAMLQPLARRLGSTFQERAQEAIRCYGAHAYLACCAMCGAAAESVLLELAIAKSGDTDSVMRAYNSQSGRSRVETGLLGQAPDPLKREFNGYMSLLKYWRDDAAHGKASGIADNEAYTSLALLLRFANFANDRWADLTGNGA